MGLPETYSRVKKSIVAFIPKYVPIPSSDDPALVFPPIIGTGFIVREDGLIITNDHVVRAFAKLFRPSDAEDDDWGIFAVLFHLTDHGLMTIRLEVLGVARITHSNPGQVYYDPNPPDLGIVHVKARGLPILEIDERSTIVEGTELATAGFPMGTDALMAPGWLHQITPTLQRGIVSAVLPFPCEKPHAFTLNVMTQGGASGSPVFYPDTGKVAGVLYGGLNDFDETDQKVVYRMPTTISYVVPSHYIIQSLENLASNPEITAPSDAMTIDEILQSGQIVNMFPRIKQSQAQRAENLLRRIEIIHPSHSEEKE